MHTIGPMFAALLMLAACSNPAPEPPPKAPIAPVQTPEPPPPPPKPVLTFNPQLPDRVGLPVAPIGAEPPRADLVVTETGGLASEGAVSVRVEGPFEVDGEPGPLPGKGRRVFGVRYTGSTAARAVASGWAVVTLGENETRIPIGAAVVDPDLPVSVSWRWVPMGREAIVSLSSAPFPYGRAPYQDSSVLIFVPDGFSGRPGAGAVVHAHGYHARLVPMAQRYELREMFARAHRDAVLILPQGPLDAADMSLGRLDKRDGLRDLLLDVAALMFRDGLMDQPHEFPAVLSAHSGGYRGVANMIEVGGAKVVAAHLFDALYSRPTTFYDLARRGGRVRSSWTYRSSTETQNDLLSDALKANGVRVGTSFLGRDVARDKVSIGLIRASHDGVMQADRHFTRWVAASGLPPGPWAPPELMFAVARDDKVAVRWRRDVSGERLCRVEGSKDGVEWTTLAETRENEAEVEPHPWIRVVAIEPGWGEGLASDRYGATGSRWLVVDGFDRSFEGQWGQATHGFAAALGAALGEPFSVASNEAIIEGSVKLEDYERVLWFVGDESGADKVLDPWEWRAVSRYLDGGGRMIVSGSGLGLGIRPALMARLFEARIVDDSVDSDTVEGWKIGAAYPEPGACALDGPEVIWSYDTIGGAAVGKPGRWALVGFGLETLADGDRSAAVRALVDYLR